MPPVDLGIPGLLDARLLGRGGFGTVYSATEPEFGRTVAVKVLRQRFDDDAVRRAFARECRAMGAVSGHPHIVTVHRGGATADGAPYIVMDLMSGGSLADRVERGPLPWPEVLDIGVVLAGALETAHHHGVLHLDLKPANVLVSRYGEPKLADFGISRLAGAAETSAGLRASPAFTAPERLADGSATVATDVYGLGATLFTLLAGSPAFQGGSDEPIVVLARVLGLPVPDLRGRGVPDPVCRVLERLMAKSPDERYATAAAAAEALQDAQRATGRPPTRPVVEGAPTAREEAAAATSLALGAVPAVRPGSPTVDGPGPPATPGS
ncbi:MAG: serine/threonine-protein kinase, partial [Pseudonocardiales bacterium]|nr:serine/threonine-protein kinase [Pseudonocardiales bacterium]